MDNLNVYPGSSQTSSRSASPGRPLSAMLGSSPAISKTSHSALRSSADGGSTGSASSGVGISGSSRHRRKSPLLSRKDAHGTENIGGIHLDPLLPRHMHDELIHTNSQDDTEVFLQASSHLSNGSSEHITQDEPDVPSGPVSDATRTRAAIEHMQNKISRTKDQIRSEQTARDDNVNEYLKLAANADKQQLQRIKSVFEKKNQKSAQSISQLQKKLESYNKRLRELETYGVHSSHRQPREVLRDVGQGLKNVGGNIRDGISGFSGGVVENIKGGFHGAAETVMSKPREFAHLLKNKFGSADNINSLSRNGESGSTEDNEKAHHGSATLPGNCTLTTPQPHTSSAGVIKFASDEGSPCSSVTSESLPAGQVTHQSSPRQLITGSINIDPILTELQERKEEIERLRERLDGFKVRETVQQEMQYLSHALQEERFRSERLEEQVNDLTELHQNEVENLKQALTDMEEKVQYQSEERLRDIHEMLECCQTKISKMEHQQAQHQQYVNFEGLDNSNARALVVKLINILLTVLQVVLLLVATAAGILMPFLKTRLRILSTLALIAGIVFVLKQWPEVKDVGSHLMRHIKQALSVK